ncbi:MAG: DUF1573 domain-containing protein [Blastocatellia bacterium]
MILSIRLRNALAGLLLLVLAASASAQSRSDAPQPHLSLAETEFNAGEVKQGDEVSHTFIVKNNGKANLEIKNVKPG